MKILYLPAIALLSISLITSCKKSGAEVCSRCELKEVCYTCAGGNHDGQVFCDRDLSEAYYKHICEQAGGTHAKLPERTSDVQELCNEDIYELNDSKRSLKALGYTCDRNGQLPIICN